MNTHLERSKIKQAAHAGYHAALDWICGRTDRPDNPFAGRMYEETLEWRKAFDERVGKYRMEEA